MSNILPKPSSITRSLSEFLIDQKIVTSTLGRVKRSHGIPLWCSVNEISVFKVPCSSYSGFIFQCSERGHTKEWAEEISVLHAAKGMFFFILQPETRGLRAFFVETLVDGSFIIWSSYFILVDYSLVELVISSRRGLIMLTTNAVKIAQGTV